MPVLAKQTQLPLEICLMIIDCIADDKPSLATCALVCRAWCHVARPHHFKSLSLRSQTNISARSLLSDGTHPILSSIRHLLIEDGEDNALWVNDLLPRMRLNEMANLESLTLEHLHWDDCQPQARAVVLSSLHRVRELCLRPIYTSTVLDTLELLAAAPSLKRFVHVDGDQSDYVTSREFTQDDLCARVPAACLPRGLTHLETNESELLHAICCLAPLPPITELVVDDVDTLFATTLVAFLRASGSTLRHLTITFIWYFDTKAEDAFVSLGGLTHSPTLRTLTLSISYLGTALRILKQLTSPHVRLVSILLALRMPYNLSNPAGFDPRSLATLFTQPPLTRARLRFIVDEDRLPVLCDLRRVAREQASVLWEEGRLDLWSRTAGAGTDALLDAHEASRANEASLWDIFPALGD